MTDTLCGLLPAVLEVLQHCQPPCLYGRPVGSLGSQRTTVRGKVVLPSETNPHTPLQGKSL
jgi:hypothetical protein